MKTDIPSFFDVIIMGGGPGGATLGALLAKKTSLKVAIFESETFPREHIGESFAHPLIPVLEESGALAKVRDAECCVRKYGGIFNWDASGPRVAFFDHANYLSDGVARWAMHANRAEFDKILLDHARDTGVSVFEGTAVERYIPGDEACAVVLSGGAKVTGRIFVDASGRQQSIATGQGRAWLSSYRNIAIWNHYLGGKPLQELEADWNVFHKEGKSPIGCFAFRDGWCWYIPVPRIIDGERKLTHSIGIVTAPAILKEDGKDYTDEATFRRQIAEVPMLRDLIGQVRPVSSRMLTATNYSMINERFCDYDKRWLLVGDASYFVDPLFSSGVAFAVAQASAVSLVIQSTLGDGFSVQQKRDLWEDYDREWHGMAETFALSIDQWYHAIARANPGGTYWKMRGNSPELGVREETFLHLLNTAFTPDLLQLMTRSGRMQDLDAEGPYMRASAIARPPSVSDATLVTLAPDVELRETIGVDVPGFKAFIPPPPFEIPPQAKTQIAHYWEDPVRNGSAAPNPHDAPLRVHRFERRGEPGAPYARSVEQRDGGVGLYEILQRGPTPLGELKKRISSDQERLLTRLIAARLVVCQPEGKAVDASPARAAATAE
jgi:flavin-dependent dehydrogenase